MNFVSASIYNRIALLALNEGLDKNLIKLNQLSEVDHLGTGYLPIDHLLRMYELGEEHSRGFALRAGQALQIDDYQTLGLSWKTAWSVRDIFLRSIRFLILITNKGDFDLRDKGAHSVFSLNNRPVHRKGQAISNEVTFIVLLNIIREVTGVELSPLQTNFKHAEPKNIAGYLRFFNGEVAFNQPENAMIFLSKDLETPSIKADKSVHKFIVERLEEEKKGIEKMSNLVALDIEYLIREALPSGIPSIVEIGKHMGMSRRTIARKLSEYGLSYRELIRKIQEDLSKDLLQNHQLSIAEIAFQTGFSEQSAFNKAFKRWTGQSPSGYRKSIRN